jgi:hypothetical protein
VVVGIVIVNVAASQAASMKVVSASSWGVIDPDGVVVENPELNLILISLPVPQIRFTLGLKLAENVYVAPVCRVFEDQFSAK